MTLFLVPYDLGQPNVGEGAGPDLLLRSGARSIFTDAGHRVRRVRRIRLARETGTEVGNIFSLASALSLQVRAVRQEGGVPVVLGGNCNTAIGVMAGLSDEPAPGLVWFDAHGDLNTPETSESGYFDGMPLAVILGWCWTAMARAVPGFSPVSEEFVMHVGGRDFDSGEREALNASRIGVVDARRLRSPSRGATLAQGARRLAQRVSGIDLHLDLDVMDKRDGVANRFAAAGGPRLGAIEAAIRTVGEACEVRALTLCSYNPGVDSDRRGLRAAMRLLRALASTLDG